MSQSINFVISRMVKLYAWRKPKRWITLCKGGNNTTDENIEITHPCIIFQEGSNDCYGTTADCILCDHQKCDNV